MATSDTAAPGLPTGPQLLALEQQVRRQGTGLKPIDLVGCWQLQLVWPKGRIESNQLSSTLLRSLGARLIIATASSVEGGLTIANVVNLGSLQLRFDGSARLIGKRPLLQFSFSHLEFRLGGTVLLRRALAPVASQRLPFFALIARDRNGWLAARGRGGGLALWVLVP
jgi:hypothetical protein